MSNYSVKLTKCGKCQFSLAHLPSGGGERVTDLGADLGTDLQMPSHLGPLRRGPGQGQCPPGRSMGRYRDGCRVPGTPGRAVGMLWLGLRARRKPAPRPDGQDAELLNYEY